MGRASGFTLIELAIVVAIIGFISVGLLRLMQSVQSRTDETDTDLALREVQSALRSHLVRFNRLPCPAGSNVASGGAGYGIEAAVSPLGEVTGCNGAVVTSFAVGADTVYRGVVPFRTLGVTRQGSVDGWENQLTYQVVHGAVVENSYSSSVWPELNQVFDSPDLAVRVREDAVVILISHGRNAFGASTIDGGIREAPPVGALAERENLDTDEDADEVFVQADPSADQDAPFDDIVVSLSESQLVAPLVTEGRFLPRTTVARRMVERVSDALYSFVIFSSDDPDGLPSPAGCDCRRVNRPADDAYCPANPTDPQCNVCLPILRDQPPSFVVSPADLPGCLRTVRRGLPWPDTDADGQPDANPVDDFGSQVGEVPYLVLRLGLFQTIDPWGNSIQYEVDDHTADEAASAEAGLYSAQPAVAVARVWSFGPNGISDSIGQFSCVGDDICVIRTVNDFLGSLMTSRVTVD